LPAIRFDGIDFVGEEVRKDAFVVHLQFKPSAGRASFFASFEKRKR
jgi:hypothetical protein